MAKKSMTNKELRASKRSVLFTSGNTPGDSLASSIFEEKATKGKEMTDLVGAKDNKPKKQRFKTAVLKSRRKRGRRRYTKQKSNSSDSGEWEESFVPRKPKNMKEIVKVAVNDYKIKRMLWQCKGGYTSSTTEEDDNDIEEQAVNEDGKSSNQNESITAIRRTSIGFDQHDNEKDNDVDESPTGIPLAKRVTYNPNKRYRFRSVVLMQMAADKRRKRAYTSEKYDGDTSKSSLDEEKEEPKKPKKKVAVPLAGTRRTTHIIMK